MKKLIAVIGLAALALVGNCQESIVWRSLYQGNTNGEVTATPPFGVISNQTCWNTNQWLPSQAFTGRPADGWYKGWIAIPQGVPITFAIDAYVPVNGAAGNTTNVQFGLDWSSDGVYGTSNQPTTVSFNSLILNGGTNEYYCTVPVYFTNVSFFRLTSITSAPVTGVMIISNKWGAVR